MRETGIADAGRIRHRLRRNKQPVNLHNLCGHGLLGPARLPEIPPLARECPGPESNRQHLSLLRRAALPKFAHRGSMVAEGIEPPWSAV